MASTLPIRIYYEDTDFSGVVYHASYLRFMERGRTEYLRERGLGQLQMSKSEGIMFVVKRLEADYCSPALMDDEIIVKTAICEMRGASFVMDQQILRGNDCLVKAKVTVAGLLNRRPVRLSDSLKVCLQSKHR